VLTIRKLIAGIFLGAAIAATSGHATAAPAPTILNGFHTVYELRYAALRGDATIALQATDVPNEYLYSVTTRTRGIARLLRPGTASEIARFRYDENGFRPLSYRLDDGIAKAENDSTIQFNWQTGIATSTHGTETVELPIRAGMLDRLTADIAAIQTLRKGEPLTGFDLVDRNEIRRYEYTLQGEETIRVPAGTFRTVKYMRRRPGSSRATLIWFAPDREYLPVKMTQLKRGESVIEMFATVLEPLNSTSAATPAR
jgi:Protein of unknown function (DUF3108)